MGSEHTKHFHADVRWLLRGKVLTCLSKLREEVILFLHPSDELYNRINFSLISNGLLSWHTWLLFSLNNLNVSLQEKAVTINVQDKIKATCLIMELSCGRLDRREFEFSYTR